MFGSNVLDTVFALIFVFLCVSLVCTAINELVAIAFASRARDLERGIRNMLDGTSRFPLRWWQEKTAIRNPSPNAWSEKFFNHQLINGVRKDNQMPSYIPSQDFVNVLLHLVKLDAVQVPGGPPVGTLNGLSSFDEIRAVVTKVSNDNIRQILLPILDEAQSDLAAGVSAFQKFSGRIQVWYDQGMDRVGGWYKKRTQWVLLAIAVCVVAALNIDTIAIYQRLARDGTLRASIVAAAEKTAAANPGAQAPSPTTQSVSQAIEGVKSSLGQFDQLGIPVGWSQAEPVAGFWDVVSKILGLLATAVAASLGAPFWFDVLNKFMSVRGTGKAPEEKPKGPKVILQPQTPEGG